VRTLSLSIDEMIKLEALMKKFMGVSAAYETHYNDEVVEWHKDDEVFHGNWLYITMVLLPQYIGDWHLDANWMVTHMTAKKFKHPIDYLYEKYIDEEK
jgi:hypothetical protein